MILEDGKRFVAFFDVLGFSSWVKSEGSKEVFTYIRGYMNLMIRSSLPKFKVNPDMSVDLEESNIGYINFSDSIVFYTQDDSYECFKTLLHVCGEFMNVVILGPTRMIRGAIAYGDFYADPESNAYVGQALIDAYKLEGLQEFLACSIHSSVEELPMFRDILKEFPNYIVKSLITLRGKNTIPYCINWISKDVGGSHNVKNCLESCHKSGLIALKDDLGELEKLNRRIKNTLEFVNEYLER